MKTSAGKGESFINVIKGSFIRGSMMLITDIIMLIEVQKTGFHYITLNRSIGSYYE